MFISPTSSEEPSAPGSPLIEAHGVAKTYKSKSGPVHALAGLDIAVPEGAVMALLGPNGAGKTTAVKVLTTLIKPDAGTVTIDGINVLAHPKEVRRIIGVSGQYAAVDENLTGMENLRMVGRLYHLPDRQARARAAELIDMFDLAEAGNRPVKGYSGGMRRRLDLAGALVNSPRVLFLDEPTSGLDPRSRLALWQVIKDLVAGGTTLLLTTQYLEEADQLADTVAVIDHGTVIAEGTSDQLKSRIGGHSVAVALVDGNDAAAAEAVLARHGSGQPHTADDGRALEVSVQNGPASLQLVLSDLQAQGIGLHDAGIRRPTLDDVFLQLTGRPAEEEPEAGAAADADDKEGARR
ncbi:ATP-binding cassette domain-containing protein [Arthrobacter sp. zg-Y820]|uniref:ATP-binding cassette domain-containing protein n=1 Tax=unclassified Arthrobacter TaxID=235627 RepID=UPI001E325217|nr:MULTISPECIES: ATP-binding cassette domain-containing protein [unclassified Arthrobacter]MCC9197335.1 ATP-binding cassette domain-containing protein [Arthrobacter sp. zg-Y820]MDK1280200.1 ATP-binding cassette domain-containing protein [Arthrobacter sp. zg.Y820]MDK1360664.1 ATP-binding cassette domain-containing protein [Arthrobacter sp. zg-Y1219]WIB09491.1 ATP-binding cassette domain-containing protein [Arthrobacter sp. zg-Y820]